MPVALRERAEAFEQDVETALVDGNGLVLAALNLDTMRPFATGYFNDKHVHRYPGATYEDFADYMAYENVGMCSGAYLAAMVWKFHATQDPGALARARRTFSGIRHLYELSGQVEDGFYCKCYGGKLSDQISSDQYLYTLAGLDRFLPYATSAERHAGVKMIDGMVRFWMRRRYAYPYFGRPLDWPLARFPAFPWLAWRHTGRPEFREEFDRLCALPAVRQELPFAVRDWEETLRAVGAREPNADFERKTGKRCLWVSPESTESGFLSIEPLLEGNAPDRALWLDKTRRLYDFGRRGIAEDGYGFGPHLYDPRTGELTEIREVLQSGEGADGWRFLHFVGWIRSGMHSAMFARAAVAIHAYFPDLGALATAQHILKRLTRDKLRWFVDMDGQQLPPDMRWMDRVYSGDAVTHWLWAYWEARARHGAAALACPG